MGVPRIIFLCMVCDVFPAMGALSPARNLFPVASSFWQRPWASLACVGSTATHYCLPSHYCPKIWYRPLLLPDPLDSLLAEIIYLPQSPLLRPPYTRPPPPLHVGLDYLPSGSMPLLRSPMLLLHRTRPPL